MSTLDILPELVPIWIKERKMSLSEGNNVLKNRPIFLVVPVKDLNPHSMASPRTSDLQKSIKSLGICSCEEGDQKIIRDYLNIKEPNFFENSVYLWMRNDGCPSVCPSDCKHKMARKSYCITKKGGIWDFVEECAFDAFGWLDEQNLIFRKVA